MTVSEAGSISSAARLMHAGQSSVSETVQSLERQATQELFVRTRTGVVMTAAGRRLEQAARAIVESHDRVLRELRNPAATSNVVSLGVPMDLPPELLTSVRSRLAITSPALRLDLRPGSTAAQGEALRHAQLDVALLRDRPEEPNIDSIIVLEEPMSVIASAAAIGGAGPGSAISLDDLAGLRWISFERDETPRWWDHVAATFRAHGAVVEDDWGLGGPLTADLKLAAARDGLSFALVPPSWTFETPEGLARYSLTGAPLVRRTWLVWSADSTRRDVAAVVAAFE